MKYSRFEELPVWQDAIELAVKIYELTSRPVFTGQYSLRDQLERSGVSVSNNIAEGLSEGLRRSFSRSYISHAAHVVKCGRCSACWNACRVLII